MSIKIFGAKLSNGRIDQVKFTPVGFRSAERRIACLLEKTSFSNGVIAAKNTEHIMSMTTYDVSNVLATSYSQVTALKTRVKGSKAWVGVPSGAAFDILLPQNNSRHHKRVTFCHRRRGPHKRGTHMMADVPNPGRASAPYSSGAIFPSSQFTIGPQVPGIKGHYDLLVEDTPRVISVFHFEAFPNHLLLVAPPAMEDVPAAYFVFGKAGMTERGKNFSPSYP